MHESTRLATCFVDHQTVSEDLISLQERKTMTLRPLSQDLARDKNAGRSASKQKLQGITRHLVSSVAELI